MGKGNKEREERKGETEKRRKWRYQKRRKVVGKEVKSRRERRGVHREEERECKDEREGWKRVKEGVYVQKQLHVL